MAADGAARSLHWAATMCVPAVAMAGGIAKEMDGVEADVAAVSGCSAAMVHWWVTDLLLLGATAGMPLINRDATYEQRYLDGSSLIGRRLELLTRGCAGRCFAGHDDGASVVQTAWMWIDGRMAVVEKDDGDVTAAADDRIDLKTVPIEDGEDKSAGEREGCCCQCLSLLLSPACGHDKSELLAPSLSYLMA
ncbi:hypothetical protein ACLOJK_039006 [Asimina triloba]